MFKSLKLWGWCFMGLEDIEGVYLPKNFYMEGVDVKVRDNNLYVSGVIQVDNKKLVAVDDLLVKNSDGFVLIPMNPEPASLEDIAKHTVNPESLRCYELPGFEDGDKSIVKVLRDDTVFGEGSEVLRLEEGVYFVRDGFLIFKSGKDYDLISEIEEADKKLKKRLYEIYSLIYESEEADEKADKELKELLEFIKDPNTYRTNEKFREMLIFDMTYGVSEMMGKTVGRDEYFYYVIDGEIINQPSGAIFVDAKPVAIIPRKQWDKFLKKKKR